MEKPFDRSSAKRQNDTPGVPTFLEGGIPRMEVESWWGLLAPAGVRPSIRDRLVTVMRKVMQPQAVKARMSSVGVSEPADLGPAALQQMIATDSTRWQEVVRRADIQLQ